MYCSTAAAADDDGLTSTTREFYRALLERLCAENVPFLVGGAYALHRYTDITRDTKDLDVFLRPEHGDWALDVLARMGCRTERTFPHWLAKAYRGEDFVDLIYSSGNGLAVVDDAWFEHSVAADVLGLRLRVCPAEEVIWSKAFIMERERFDGADVAHLLHARMEKLDWSRLLSRFRDHWRVLLGHLVLFGFIYPSERSRVPRWVMEHLLGLLNEEMSSAGNRVCYGTLLSRAQYLVDVESWCYADARLHPDVKMEPEDIALWTDAIDTPRPLHAPRR